MLDTQERRPLRDYRLLAGAAIVAILISLLLNNAGIAILLSVFLIPGLALLWITDLDLFERESWGAIIGALAGGLIATAIGAAWTLTLAEIGMLLAVLPLVVSPVRTVATISQAKTEDEAVPESLEPAMMSS